MKLNYKKKRAEFIAYPEVKTVAMMTDEELRLALAEYGMKPLTRLPDVLQSLTTGNRPIARVRIESFCKLLPSLLTQPGLLGILVALALLLGCFGIIATQNFRVPTGLIEQVTLRGPYDTLLWLLLLWQCLKFFFRRIRPWIRTSEETPKNKTKARHQTAALFSAFVIACSVAFALLLLLKVTLPQTFPRTPIILLLGGAAGALSVMGTLLLVFGLPVYSYAIDLAEQSHSLEERCRRLDLQTQALEDHHHKLEERLKAIESQSQASEPMEEQLPMQRNLAFMEMRQVEKRDNATDLRKSRRMSRLNSASS